MINRSQISVPNPAPGMLLTNILFNPTARVWNLRVLVLEIIATCVFLALAVPGFRLNFGDPEPVYYLPWDILFSTFGLILVHHLSFVFNWSIRCLAMVDLILISLEVCGIVAGLTVINAGIWVEPKARLLIPAPLRFACIPIALSLVISIAFRVATIFRSNERFFRQRFRFLGSCVAQKVPYTPMAIFLNRSVGRPLVRGESVAIITARAFVLNCIGLAVPAFGIYVMVFSPIKAQIYTRSVATFAAGDLSAPPGNATFFIGYFQFDQSQDFDYFAINFVTVRTDVPQSYNCSVNFEVPSVQCLVECPLPWTSVLSVSISINIPPGFVVTIGPLPEKPVIDSVLGITFAYPEVEFDPTPMVSGSHLFGRLSWIQRETLSRWGLGFPNALKPVFTPEITGLQTLPRSPASPTNEATLLLYQPYTTARKLQQDSSDVSPLSGFSTFGGFWTFVNGAFALFFGANVVYFALGRRPLSALGLIHIFQRNTLVRRWHTDFPTLRTEGGVPGSESAGIVAFIRERLIDIEEEPEPPASFKNDAEGQSSDFNQAGNGSRASMMDADYRLELPLLNSSLGFENGVSQELGRVESQT